MSLRAPRRSNADGLSENVLKAILEPAAAYMAETQKMKEEGNENGGSENTNIDQRNQLLQQASQRGSIGSFLDTTSLSTCSKRSLHSSRLTLSDSKEFYKTVGCRWIRSVRHGDVSTVKKMLEENSELVNYAPTYGPLALHLAAARSDRSIILLLLAKGAEVDSRDAAGYTCLQLAIRRGNQSLAHFLILQGANIELIDPDGRGIIDYDGWSGEDQRSAEKHFYGKIILRPKAHSFVGSPSSISMKSSKSTRTMRPSSTPNDSMISEYESSNLKRNEKQRSSWMSFFKSHTIFGSNSKS